MSSIEKILPSSPILAEEFSYAKIQAVIFTPNFSYFSQPMAIARALVRNIERYQADIQSFPSAGLDPNEPHVILSSPDGNWEMRLSPARTDAFWHRLDETSEKAVSDNVEILCRYAQDMKADVGRLSLVLTYLRATEDANTALIRHFCPEWPDLFGESLVFEIVNGGKYMSARDDFSIPLNRAIRIRSGSIRTNNAPALIIEIDINTPLEIATDTIFTEFAIRRFFEVAEQDGAAVMERFFPS